MSKTPLYWNKAKKYLSKKDKVMKKLIEKYSDASLTTRKNIFLSRLQTLFRSSKCETCIKFMFFFWTK